MDFKIVLKALEAPLRQIAINAGKDDASVIQIEKIKNEKGNGGYDALRDMWVLDMISAGIIGDRSKSRASVSKTRRRRLPYFSQPKWRLPTNRRRKRMARNIITGGNTRLAFCS